MAIHLVEEIEKIAQREMDDFVNNEVVPYAKNMAPQCTGAMSHQIRATDLGNFTWIVSTHSSNNGFEYPAHIEAGEGVVATNKKALRFRIHGREIITKSTKPSYKSHFMANTVSAFK